jgi:ferredoxin
VAEVIAASLKETSVDVHLLDLGIVKSPSGFVDKLQAAGEGACLFVGSPVYRDMAVPPVMAFIDNLPTVPDLSAVPFVTWGGAFSGIALWQMGRALVSKGFRLAGAAKVLAVHSMMWPSAHPVGHGHPDADDDRQVAGLVDRVVARLSQTDGTPLPVDALDYHPEALVADIKKKLGQPWMIIPKTIDQERCTQCAICKQICPVSAVALDPWPVFDQNCFDCFNCIRECPEEAIVPAVAFDQIESMIRERVARFDEQPPTQLFC